MKKKYEKPKITRRNIALNAFFASSRMNDGQDIITSGLLAQGACSGTFGGTYICGTSIASSGTGTCTTNCT